MLKGYPRLSEMFIASEVYRVERLGVPLRLFVLKAADEEVHHDVVRACSGRPSTCWRRRRCPRPALLRWLAANLGLFLPALLRTARRHPAGLARAAGLALAQAVRARRRSWPPPRKIYLKELLRAVDLADRLDARR